jgi:hypothetical protein
MAVVNPPAWLQAGEYPAHTDRLVTSSIVGTEGVVEVGDLALTQNTTPGMSVKVAPGRAWIRDAVAGTNENKGMYNFVNDADVVLSVAAAHASLGRIDRVVARVQDAAVSGVTNLASLEVITGTPASSPAAPALPASSLSLGTINVAANQTTVSNSNITSAVPLAKVHKNMVDSVPVVTSSTRPVGADRTLGMMIFESDTLRTWQWNGSEWQFRGGRGPRAIVRRSGSWGMSTTAQYISSLDPETGSNFETAYYTFVNSESSSNGDRIRVKQSGMYAFEMYLDMYRSGDGFVADFYADVVVGSTGLPSYAVDMPRVGGHFRSGRNRSHTSRVVYLPVGAEIRFRYDAGSADVQVDAFWANLTLIG